MSILRASPSYTDTLRDVQALDLLHYQLVSGHPEQKSAFVPPPSYLALISTLVVHPKLTTRASSAEDLEASNLALRYLWATAKLLGSAKLPLIEAFHFRDGRSSTLRGGRRRANDKDFTSPTSIAGPHSLNSVFAITEALWEQVGDFWQVVGWAFNCSILHKHRWERWSLWLDLMISWFEDDLKHRGNTYRGAHHGAEVSRPPIDSLLLYYLSRDTFHGRRQRRIISSIFADGTKSVSAFPEVWKHETRLRKKKEAMEEKASDRVKIDIEEDQYRDYQLREESDLEEAPLSSTKSHSTVKSDITAFSEGPQALDLRLRLLALVAQACWDFPNLVMSTSNFYDQVVEHLRPLPLPTFSLFLSSSSLHNFQIDAAAALILNLLGSLTISSAPAPPEGTVSQQLLEKCYLPYPALTSTLSDNAKMSICIEAALGLLLSHNMLSWTIDLERTAYKGIDARHKKCAGSDGLKTWLHASSLRIKGIILVLKQIDD